MATTIEQEFAEALALQRQGNPAGAEKTWRNLLARHGAHADAEHMLGLSLHAQKRHAEALPWFERADRHEGNPMLWSNHAAALIALDRTSEAICLCRRAIQIDPRHFGAWLNLGIAHEAARNFAEAIPALETALRIRPADARATLALARSRLRVGSPDAALQALAAFVQGADPELDLIRCEAWIESGEATAATTLLRHLVECESVRAQSLVLQARIVEREHSDEARELLEQALALDPENQDACARLAWLDISRGETEAGLQRLRGWLDRHPGDWNAANVYLMACQNSPRIDAAALLAEHRRLRPAPATAPAWPAGWRRGGKLRIGWLSAHG
jgi:tetratricopeptide (TPR) repeat protein